jgi:hypothetical protein
MADLPHDILQNMRATITAEGDRDKSVNLDADLRTEQLTGTTAKEVQNDAIKQDVNEPWESRSVDMRERGETNKGTRPGNM